MTFRFAYVVISVVSLPQETKPPAQDSGDTAPTGGQTGTPEEKALIGESAESVQSADNITIHIERMKQKMQRMTKKCHNCA